jgi:DNA-binding beta-propeller fold protein YncE
MRDLRIRSGYLAGELMAAALPAAVAVDPANHTMYVTSEQGGTIAVLSDRLPADGR